MSLEGACLFRAIWCRYSYYRLRRIECDCGSGCGCFYGKRIAKSMSFLVDEKPVMIVFAGDARVDNHKFKERFHKKASMIKPDAVEDLVGHPVGGVCPFALKERA